MKKKLLYLSGGIVLLMVTCTPIEKRQEAGPLLQPADISVNVYNTTPGGNQIVMINNTPLAAGNWDYVIAKSIRQQDTILLPFLGKTTITFNATTAGGIVSVKKDVIVTKIDHPADKMWSYLAGTGSKTWVWATQLPSAYGNGGYKGCSAPCWWSTSVTDLTGWGVLNDQMIFDLNGGANYTLVTGNTAGDGLKAGTYKGSFLFDKTKGINYDDGTTYAAASILLGQPVSRGFQPNGGSSGARPNIYEYYFLKINDTEMNLVVPEPGQGSWGTAWFWMFKPKP
jgi:hypothetical protein